MSIGYDPALVSTDIRLWDGAPPVPLLAYSRRPKDLRTSAVAVVRGPGVGSAQRTGAPYAIAIDGDRFDWWSVGGVANDQRLMSGSLNALETFFSDNRQHFNPDTIYRAKTWGRLEPEWRQGDFIDAGLMPLVERDIGLSVRRLLEENVKSLASSLGWNNLTDSDLDASKAEWLIKAPFWLLAAKILRDKGVHGFGRLALTNLESVFERLARHYQKDNPQGLVVLDDRRKALLGIAETIDNFASLELLSTEALGYVYESTLINAATRKRLGTHSTPSWLIEYVVGRLRPWIAEMPPEARHVFEPGCGHGGFLVAALRLLDELRPVDFAEDRKTYLRRRLHGVDVDPFSQEVARLALTLADVPNPNGWDLTIEDMFSSDVITKTTSRASVVLANPPFESFGANRKRGWLPNKAAETFSRVVSALKEGSVFGFVVPQSLLQNKQGAPLREQLLRGCEISEITLLADELFEFGDPECAVILGRKRQVGGARSTLYQRVREKQVGTFAATFTPSSSQTVTLPHGESLSLLVPELMDVWEYLAKVHVSTLGTVAHLGQGFFQKGAKDPTLTAGLLLQSDTFFAGATEGFAGWKPSQQTHLLPPKVWFNLGSAAIDRKVLGCTTGVPQVLLNYAPVSRQPWRLKALLDEAGHAVTSRFIVVRPRSSDWPVEALWALLNSPLANAFAYCHLSKRDNLVGKMRELPVPASDANVDSLVTAVAAYLGAARRHAAIHAAPKEQRAPLLEWSSQGNAEADDAPTKEHLRDLHWRIDAEIMQLYGLPPEIERRVLDLFAGVSRGGVPFAQSEYYPREFRRLLTMADLAAITADWAGHAKRKSALIEKKVQRRASPEELQELKEIKRLAGARLELLAPLPIAEWRAVRDKLRRNSKPVFEQ